MLKTHRHRTGQRPGAWSLALNTTPPAHYENANYDGADVQQLTAIAPHLVVARKRLAHRSRDWGM
eukprot:365309-Chlamydomonas_euryale.AAC.10